MRTSLVTLAALCAAPPLPAEEAPGASRVCIGAIQSEGLERGALDAFRERLQEEATALGAELIPSSSSARADGTSFVDPACTTPGSDSLKVEGVLVAELFRLGPMVRVKLRAVDLTSGGTLAEAQSTVSRRGFPASAKLRRPLRKLLEKIPPRDKPQEPEPSDPEPELDPNSSVASADPKPAADDGDDPDPAVDADRGSSPGTLLGFGALGLSSLLLAGGAVTGGLALALDQDLRQACQGESCPPEREEDITSLTTLAWTANGLLGAGLVAALAGVGALVFLGGEPTEAAESGTEG